MDSNFVPMAAAHLGFHLRAPYVERRPAFRPDLGVVAAAFREAKERLEREREAAKPGSDDAAEVAVGLDPETFVTRPQGRRAWLGKAAAPLTASAKSKRGRSPTSGPTGCSRPRRLEEELDVEQASNAAYEAWRARGVAADGSRRMAPGMLKPYQPPVAPTGLMNTTDLDSRVVRTHGQPPLQGYNAQAAVNEHQIVVAAKVTVDSPDFGHLEPMVDATRRELRRHGLADPCVVLADAGYWHQRQIERVVADGMQVLVPPDGGLRKGTRPGWDGGFYDFMRRVLATPEGRSLYRQRQITVEPVFGQIKFNRAIKRFQRRGRAACRSEWRLIAATHNLLKLHNHRIAATTA